MLGNAQGFVYARQALALQTQPHPQPPKLTSYNKKFKALEKQAGRLDGRAVWGAQQDPVTKRFKSTQAKKMSL